MPAFKIGSGDITNLPLLEAVERTGMPVFLATGAATIEEVSKLWHYLRIVLFAL